MLLRSLSLFILLVILSGCVSTSKPQDAQVLSATHGFTFVHFPRVHPSLSLKSLSNKKTYNLRYNRDSNSSSLWLPAGEYELKKLSYSHDKLTSHTVKLTGYPTIAIKKGEIINLGSLINFNVGEGKEVWLPISSKESQLLAQAEQNKYKDFLTTNAVIQWQPVDLPDINKGRKGSAGLGLIADFGLAYTDSLQEGKLKEALLAIDDIDSFYNVMVKVLPPRIDQQLSYDKQGNLYLAADLGQIKQRSPKGVWTSIDTGTLDSITKVHWHQGNLFAVAGKNKILVSKDKGAQWHTYTQIDSNQTIYDIDGIKDDLLILSATNESSSNIFILGEDYNLSVYRANYNNAENIGLIKNIEHKGDVFKNPKAIINNGIYYVGLMPDILKSLDLDSMQWRNISTPQKFSSFNIAKNGLITLLNSQGVFSDLFISENNGDSWQELNTPSYVIQDVSFNNKSNGLAYRIDVSIFSGEHILQEYNASKNTWHDITKGPQACKFIFAQSLTAPIFCITKSDTMLNFKDNKWTLEMSK